MIATLNEIKTYLSKTITTQTSGVLVVGTRYRITVVGTCDFSNVGSTFNELYETFVATSTDAPTSWGGATLQIITDEDLVIESLIPQVENHVRSICSNDFINDDYYLTADMVFAVENIQDTITVAEGFDDLYLNRYMDVYVKDSYYNDGYFLVLTKSDTVLTLNFLNELYAETTENITIKRVDYPEALKTPFIKMINYQLSNMTPVVGGNVKSESIGKYSVSYDNVSSLYSPQIIKELQMASGYTSGKTYFVL